ncbi:hypothetical protein TRFO_31328 [Tritrichomonas foetus]|uniref:Uncharacterized protein n=1 Tax=Tritrichomonas foetus TaxID=1144522 RepID=A0A1J4JRD8_9EUKA|nr:hypothetical protein TRFO_31328 [Tritrichomonas foetus]|eukprot:OHT01719.1 hypothetical protein TRFO_31328 [Tritrichomonas foetus]
MEYVRNCWNAACSPENFVDALFQRNDDDFTKSVISSLLDLTANSTIPQFLQYLGALLKYKPNLFRIILNDDQNDYGLGFIRFINYIGCNFLNIFDIDCSIENAKCVLKILTYCLTLSPEKICVDALLTLCEDQKFPLLISSSRVFYEQEIHKLRPAFRERVPHESVPFSISLLHKAVFNDNIAKVSLFQQHDLVPLILSNLLGLSKMSHFPRFLTKNSFVHFFLHVISDFVHNPSLVLAHLVVEILPGFVTGNLKQLIVDLRSHLNHGISDLKCTFFIDPDKIEVLLTSKPPNDSIPPEDLLTTVYQYPSTITCFSDRLLNLMQPENLTGFVSLIPQLLNSYYDVIFYLTIQDKFLDFIQKLIYLCEHASKNGNFADLWFLLTYYLHFNWSRGSPYIRHSLSSLTEKTSDDIRYFFTALFTYSDPNFTPSSIDSPSTSFQFTIKLLHRLINDRSLPNLKKVAEQSIMCPHFWPSILISCLCHPSHEYRILANYKLSNTPIVNELFFNLMTLINKPHKSIYLINSFFGYEMHKKLKPNNIDDLNSVIKSQIMSLETVSHITTTEFYHITCSWRAWREIFGLRNFIGTVFQVTNNITKNFKIPADSLAFYENIAFIFTITCDQKMEAINEVLDSTFDFIKESLSEMTAALGLCCFCMDMVCLTEKNWEVLFDRVFDFARTILEEDPQGENMSAVFALGFIRRSLFTPFIQNRITDVHFDYIEKFTDWPTLIDYFVVKSRLKWQGQF